MLLNLSNHPSSTWLHDQKAAALEKYHSIRDMVFPQIDPRADKVEINRIAEKYVIKIRQANPSAVHIMGEMTFSFNLINRLKAIGITCIASTTERIVKEEDGKKTSVFKFIRFREY